MPGAVILKMADLGRSQVNYRECPKNASGRCIFSGKVEVAKNHTKYGDKFGFNGVAWCAIFASWLSLMSGSTYFGKAYHFASTIAARDHAKKNHRWTTTPTVGAYSMMAHTATTGHFGFVLALLKDGYVLTVEGNTNDQGGREGNGVYLRTRHKSSWDGYILLDQTNDPTPPSNSEPPQQIDPWESLFVPVLVGD